MSPLFADLCRSVLQFGLSLWLQSAVVLGFGLIAAQIARRHGPLRRASLLQATLAATVLGMGVAALTAGQVLPSSPSFTTRTERWAQPTP